MGQIISFYACILLERASYEMKYIVKKIGNMSVKVIINEDMSSCEGSISSSDAEMDKRAVAAVRSAIYRAKVCKKPVARYDVATKRAFLEFADGSRKYVD